MAKKVKIEVISGGEKCGSGHCVGQEWVCGRHSPAGICMTAFPGLVPLIKILAYGGDFPGNDPGTVSCACPDPKGGVVFEMRRLDEES